MKLQPLSDRIIVRRLDADEKTPGGILLPDMAKEKPQRGTVLAVGQGLRLADGTCAAMECKAGMTVLFTTYAGNEVEVDGEELLVMREADVLAVVVG